MVEETRSHDKGNSPLANFIIYAFIAAVAVLSLIPVLPNEFVYDDLPLIAHNPHIRDFSNVKRFFSTDYFDLTGERTFRPVTSFTYFLDARIWGVRPFGFHVTSILLHAITTLLVLAIAKRSLTGFLPALAAAALFSLHPLAVEPIAGMSFREDLLAAAFCTASLLAFLKWRDRGSAPFLAFSWLLYLLALFSKESAGALPVVIFLICIASHRKKRLRQTIIAMSGYAAIAAAFIVCYFLMLHGGERLGRYPGGGPLGAAPVMIATFGKYLKLFVNPANLCLEYPAQSISWTDTDFILSTAVLVILLVSGIAARRRLPAYSFGIALFFTCLIPISNLLPFGAVMANRYMYLPMTGLCIATGGIISFLEGGSKNRPYHARFIILLAVFFFFIAATVKTRIDQISIWENSVTLWGNTSACCPTCPRAHTNYGIALLNAEKYEDAIVPLETAVSLDSHYEALNALGTAYLHTRQWGRAINSFSKASVRHPTSPFPPYNAGIAMMKKGDGQQALIWFRKSLDISPGFVPALYNS
ncbi:MAG: glycosyltransferase family 39 protein, partial [bacterium]